MKARIRLERVLKDLHILSGVARAGLVGAQQLDDKVEMSRTQNELDNARRLVLKNIYCIEDAEQYALNTERCSSCYSLVSKV